MMHNFTFCTFFQIAFISLLLTDTTSFKITNCFTSPLRRFNYLQSSPSPNGMDEISTRYDSLIIDQWGVLHDGIDPYPGVIEILRRLKVAGKQLILLSNSSKRKESSFKGLMKVGIDASLFDDIITSGDLAWNMITERRFDFHLPKTSETVDEKLKVFVIGNNQDDLEYITSCNCVLGSPENADFILARGTFCFMTECNSPGVENCGVIECNTAEQLVAESDYWLERCLARQLPMLVSNPDFSRPGSGAPMPGIIGKKYSNKGGVVQYVGKPYKAVYDACFELIAEPNLRKLSDSSVDVSQKDLDKRRICMIGDSLDHDIIGARNNGIESVWIANGVHSTEMGVEEGSSLLADVNVLHRMYEKYGVTPTHTIACLGTEMNLNLNLPLENILAVKEGMMFGIYNHLGSKERNELQCTSGLKQSTLTKVEDEKNYDITGLPYTIAEPDPSVDIPKSDSWIQTITSFMQSIGKPQDVRSRGRLNEEDLLSTVSELDFYLQKILSRHEIVASELFALFFDPEYIFMANINGGYESSLNKTEGISVPELLLIDAINVQTRIRGIETKGIAVKEGQIIVWKFIVIGFDIGFSILMDGECRMSNTSCNGLQFGAMMADKDGFCELIWDNSYSIFRSKQLISAVRVVEFETYHLQETRVREILQGKVHMQDLRNILELSILYHVKRLSGIMYHRKGSTGRLLAAEDYLHREEQLQELTNEIAANREKLTSLMIQEGVEKQKAIEINFPIDLDDHTCINEGTSVPIAEVFDYNVEVPSIEKDNQFLEIWNQNERNRSPTSYVSCTQCLKVSPKEITVKDIKKGEGLSMKHDKVKLHVSFARSSLADEDPLLRIRTKLVEYTESPIIPDSPLSSPDFPMTPMSSPFSTSPSSVLSSLDSTNSRIFHTAISSSLFTSSEAIPKVSKSECNDSTVILDIQGTLNESSISTTTKSPIEETFGRNRKTGLKAGMINYDYDEVKKAIYTEAQLRSMEKMILVRDNMMKKIASLSDDYNMRTESLMQRAEERERRVTQSIMDDMRKDKELNSMENNLDNQLCIDDGCNIDCIAEIGNVDIIPPSNNEDVVSSEWSSSFYQSVPTTTSLLLDASPLPSGHATYIDTDMISTFPKYTQSNQG